MNKKAIAMKYKTYENNAPKITAKGNGIIALKIIEKAKEFDIPIFQNSELTNMLMNVKLDNEIPSELYQAVVEIFIWLHNTEKKAELSN